jgi:hypothetical protein
VPCQACVKFDERSDSIRGPDLERHPGDRGGSRPRARAHAESHPGGPQDSTVTSYEPVSVSTHKRKEGSIPRIITQGGDSHIFGSNAEKLGVFGQTPVAQPSTTGETVGFTPGAGTAVNDQSTFTGNVGTKAYRLSDIDKALKQLGLIASS